MTRRLDRRKVLYGAPRLSDTQVKTLQVLAEYTSLPQASVDRAFVKTLGGNPASLDFLQRELLAREVDPGFWRITPQGLELLRDIEEAAND